MNASRQPNSRVAAVAPIGDLSGWARNAVSLLLLRLEVTNIDLFSILAAVLRLLSVAFLTILFTSLVLAWGSGLVVMLYWDRLGTTVLWIVLAVFLLVAVGLGLYCRMLLRHARRLLPISLRQLRIDVDMRS